MRIIILKRSTWILYLFLFCFLSNLNISSAQKPSKHLSFEEYAKVVGAINIKDHEISLAKFKEIYNKKDVYILDLRDPEEYKRGHITGALYLGPDIKEELVNSLVPNKKSTVIIYCANSLMPTRSISQTHVALPQIITFGYTNTFVLPDFCKISSSQNTVFNSDKNPIIDSSLWAKDSNQYR
jgi:hypothetical protein